MNLRIRRLGVRVPSSALSAILAETRVLPPMHQVLYTQETKCSAT